MNSIATRLKAFSVLVLLGLTACAEPKDIASTHPQAVISEIPFSPSAQDWPHSTSDISPDPRVTYGRLKNGLRYAILPARDETGTVSIQLNISAGWNDESEDAYGVAHLLEHIAFRGKREDGDTSIIHDLQSNGVGFGRDFNGFTTDDNTYYLINLTTPNAKDISNALTGFKGLIEASSLSPETLAVEKKIVLAELNRRNSVQERASQSSFIFENPKSARARVSGIGTEESLEGISLQHVQGFHDDHYRPEKAFIIIVGDVDFDKSRNLIKSKFSDWAKGSFEESKNSELNYESSEVISGPIFFQESGAKTEMRAIQHSPSTLGNDLLSNRKNEFIDRMFMSAFQARLALRIEEEPKVSWMKPFSRQTLTHDVKGVRMGAKDYEVGFTVFEEERRRLLKHGFTDEEFTFVFDKQRAAFRRATERGESIDAFYVASQIRRHFIKGNVYINPQQELEIFEMFEASITKEDLEKAALKTWMDFNPKYWTQSSRSMEETVKRVMVIRDTIKEDDLEQPAEGAATFFQNAALSKTGAIKSRNYIKSKDTHRLLFENGTRLNFKKNPENKNEVLVAISLKPQDDSFLKYYSAITEKLPSLSWADISGMDRLTMEKQFVGKKASFSMGVFEDRFFLFTATTPDDLQDSLEIASTFLLKFDPESKDHKRSFKKQLDRGKASMRKSPVRSGSLKLPSIYADDPPAFKSNLNRGFFNEAYRDAEMKKIIETGAIEVGVVGDFEEDAVINTFSQTIGAMPDRAPIRVDHIYSNPSVTHKPPRVETITYPGSPDQMALQYCWPLEISLKPDELAERDIFSHIVLNRVREHLREELGLTYSAEISGFSNRVFPNFSYTCFTVQIDPEYEDVTLAGFRQLFLLFMTFLLRNRNLTERENRSSLM